MRFVSRSVAALAVAGFLISSPSHAQRVIVFGDSLSDTGNARALTGNFTPGATSPLGRYSSGTNWIDQTFGTTSAFYATGVTTGNVDLAIGGARTDALAPNGFDRGIALQIGDFAAAGGAIGARDTVVIWGGANNLFQGLPAAAANPATAVATLTANTVVPAATAMLGDVQATITAGARTLIVPNLPDFAGLPGIAANGANFAALASFGSGAYNSAVATGLAQIAASAPRGTNIIQVDTAALFRVVIANPASFGFTNTTGTCQANLPTCSSFVFWDAVHPTERAYGYLAQYVGLLLNPTSAIVQTARLSESGLYANEVISNQVFDRLAAFVSGTYADRNGPYAEVIGTFGSYDADGAKGGFNMHLGGVRGGVDQKSGATLTGVSVSILSGSLSSGTIKSDLQSFRGDVYATALYGNAFVSGNVGIASLDYSGIERETGIATVKASGSTSGYVGTVAAEAGFLQSIGGLTIVPSARITYFHQKLDGYQEAADLLALNFDSRETDAVLVGGKVRVVGALPGIGLGSTAFGEVGYAGYVSSSTDPLKAQFANNTALPTTASAGELAGPGVTAKVGLSSEIGQGAFLDLQYGIAVHDGGGETHTGDIRLKATY